MFKETKITINFIQFTFKALDLLIDITDNLL